ncbi:MAG: Trk system potassium transporter TrkA [Hyphomicrobiales bacterium]|nr:Trk system potassium transporter TrkA [Hyphomicrobiales bacterium]
MKILICGAGQVGYGIAEHLSEQKNDVTVIDNAQQLIENINASLDVRTINGNGSFPDVLDNAGAKDADVIIAVTQADEVNMIICHMAQILFDIPTKIARIRSGNFLNPLYENIFTRDNIPIDVIISPEKEIAESILKNLTLPGAFEILEFGDKRITLLGVDIEKNCNVTNVQLGALTKKYPDLICTIVGINRNNNIIIPTQKDILISGDKIYLVCESEQVNKVLSILGHTESEAHNIIIAGAGNVGLYLAKSLETSKSNINVKLIELNKEIAEKAATELTKSIVLNGDILDKHLLEQAGIERSDAFVALTNNDNVNFISSVIAKEMGTKQTLSLLVDNNYNDLQDRLGIDNFINPRATTISSILRYLRKGRIRDAHSLYNGAVEVVEAEVVEASPLIGKQLKEADIPDGLRFGAILRKDNVLRPDGNIKIELHDRIVIFSLSESIHVVEQLFRTSQDYY